MTVIRFLIGCLILLSQQALAQDPCDPPLSASIISSSPVCLGDEVTLTFILPTDDGSGFDVTYSIGGNTFTLTGVATGATAQHIVTVSTTATLQQVVNNDDDDDACFTNFSFTIPITVSNPTTAITNQNNPSCGQNNGSITASASGGTSPYQFSLNGGAFQSSPTFSSLAAGNYTVVVRDATSCTASVSTTLTSADGPNIIIANQTNPSCGQNNGSITAAASGGASPYQFSLNGGTFQNSPTFSGLTAGNYTVVARDAASCTASVATTLSDLVANLPLASIQANTTQGCTTTLFVLTGNVPPGLTGVWECDEIIPPTPTNPTWNITAAAVGTLRITWTLSAPGCPNYDDVEIIINVVPPPQANTDGLFNVLSSIQTQVIVLENDVASIPVTLRILKNCTLGIAAFDDQFNLDYQPYNNAEGFDTVMYELCYTTCASLCDTALVLFRNIRNEGPCVITGDTSNVFTNGLTPNDDGQNDALVLRVVNVEECEVNQAKSEIIIYNRWGDVVFDASPYENNWGGTRDRIGGDPLPPGVYYFVLRITLDKQYTQFGSVILLR